YPGIEQPAVLAHILRGTARADRFSPPKRVTRLLHWIWDWTRRRRLRRLRGTMSRGNLNRNRLPLCWCRNPLCTHCRFHLNQRLESLNYLLHAIFSETELFESSQYLTQFRACFIKRNAIYLLSHARSTRAV